MNPSPLIAMQSIDLPGLDRWQVYQRLQELDIPCQCSLYQPLKVQISNPQQIIQIWSVTRRVTNPSKKLGEFLDSCWQLSIR